MENLYEILKGFFFGHTDSISVSLESQSVRGGNFESSENKGKVSIVVEIPNIKARKMVGAVAEFQNPVPTVAPSLQARFDSSNIWSVKPFSGNKIIQVFRNINLDENWPDPIERLLALPFRPPRFTGKSRDNRSLKPGWFCPSPIRRYHAERHSHYWFRKSEPRPILQFLSAEFDIELLSITISLVAINHCGLPPVYLDVWHRHYFFGGLHWDFTL